MSSDCKLQKHITAIQEKKNLHPAFPFHVITTYYYKKTTWISKFTPAFIQMEKQVQMMWPKSKLNPCQTKPCEINKSGVEVM